MPSGDHKGPMGQGPMTGRSLGFCAGYDTPGYAKEFGSGMGRGLRFGRTRGRGLGRGRNFAGFFPGFHRGYLVSKDDEKSMLKSQAEHLKRFQKDIERRLGELEEEKD